MKMGMKKIIATAVAGVFFSGMPIGSSVSEASDWGKIAGDFIGSLLNSASKGSSSSSGESSVNSILNLSSQKNAVMNPSSNDKLFMLAVENGDTETAAQMLAQGVNVNGVFYFSKDPYYWGVTALRKAVDNNNRPMMQFLLENGADVTGYHVFERARKKDYYISYIVLASIEQNTELVTYLHNWGADISSKGFHGWAGWGEQGYYTPVTANMMKCRTSFVWSGQTLVLMQYLLSQGAEIDEPLTFQGIQYTPFLFAVDWKWYEMMDMLADNGANIYAKDSRGRNALKIALDKEDLQLYKHVQDLMNRGQQAR